MVAIISLIVVKDTTMPIRVISTLEVFLTVSMCLMRGLVEASFLVVQVVVFPRVASRLGARPLVLSVWFVTKWATLLYNASIDLMIASKALCNLLSSLAILAN